MKINGFQLGEQPCEKEKTQFFLLVGNHLGNVMEVVSDRKVSVDEKTYDDLTGDYVSDVSDGTIDYFTADVTSYSDYYPYGMTMPNRNGSIGSKYRYAFNGMETDGEVSGSGNSYTTQFRQYDPRLGRWKSLDPLAIQFPYQSPFCAMDNKPIVLTDPLGLSTGDPVKGDSEVRTNANGSKEMWVFNGTKWEFDTKLLDAVTINAVAPKNAGLNGADYSYPHELPGYTQIMSGRVIIGEYSTPGESGDWLGVHDDYVSDDRPLWSRSDYDLSRAQANNFAEGVDGERSAPEDGVYKVRLNDESRVLRRILHELQEEGVILEDLTEFQLEKIRTFTLAVGEDNSHLFLKAHYNYTELQVPAIPMVGSGAIPVVLMPPGSSASTGISTTGEVAIGIIVAEKVDAVLNFSKVARGRQKSGEFEGWTDAEVDEEYKSLSGRKLSKGEKAWKQKVKKEQKARNTRNSQKNKSEKGVGSGN